MGITLNFMSTMAMGLVAGVLVDDAIVEIEKSFVTCAWASRATGGARAADESAWPFLQRPWRSLPSSFRSALMPGIAGQYFKAFGFTVVLSVLMSLLVARMVTPLYLRLLPALPRQAATCRVERGWISTSRCSTGIRYLQYPCAARSPAPNSGETVALLDPPLSC